MDYEKRRDRLRKMLREANAPAILITSVYNVRYLTGFTGEDSYLVVHRDGDFLLSDPRYEEQIAEECVGLHAVIRATQESLIDVTSAQLKAGKWSSVLVEADTLTLATFEKLKSTLDGTTLGLSSGLVESLRMIKDKDEIALIKVAIEIAQRVFTSVRATLRGTQTEWDIACEVERLSRLLGGNGTSFKTIAAVGARAALPHAVPGKQAVADAPFLLLDWGVMAGGYRSDLTRVLVTGRIPPKFSRMYEAVLTAQQAAIEQLKPGVMVSRVDQVAREVIDSFGMGKRFNHGLGHGIGLEIHEAPRLGRLVDRPLEPGMVVTVEPGVYFPGLGGVRIEDDVLITKDGHEVLSSLPRALDENRVELLA